MSAIELHQALRHSIKDEAMISYFLSVWPIIESILQDFATATRLPIFVFLNEQHVYHSPLERMPLFCQQLLGSQQRDRCVQDGVRRARKEEPEYLAGVQLCHAGMANGRCEIHAEGVGTLTILYGARKTVEAAALARRDDLIQAVAQMDAPLAVRLREADNTDREVEEIEKHDSKLIETISHIIQQLFKATVGFHSRATNMAHELSLMLLAMHWETKKIEYLFKDLEANPRDRQALSELLEAGTNVMRECRMGLYIVQNFLSNASEKTYKEIVRPQFTPVEIGRLLEEMIELHRKQAQDKRIDFDVTGLEELPRIRGFDMELCRLFYNVLNNAIKYSYHSTSTARRNIKIKTKVPYDPGFQERRFSIVVENYGLGLAPDETKEVFKPGFRGRRAKEEVLTGAGIGLSEAVKIMRAHGGKLVFRSTEQHKDASGLPVYLTAVEMIFPYNKETFQRKRGN